MCKNERLKNRRKPKIIKNNSHRGKVGVEKDPNQGPFLLFFYVL